MDWINKEILLTGGTGSLSKALINHFITNNYKLKGLRIFSRDELKQGQLRQDIKAPFPVAFLIGDIRNRQRLTRAMQGVDICIHTAALKQVDTSERNPWEFVETNIIGTQNTLDACIDCKVEKAMFISTDKSVYPVNLYGMTKGCAEKIWVQGNIYTGGRNPQFSCVRYGNVLGSRGSVIQLFQKQAETGSLTVTSRDMTRFWITLKQVTKFIIMAIENMKPGQIFIPRMPSMKVVDLARTMAPEADIKEIGIRPGEKIHECLVTKEESIRCAMKYDYYLIHPTNIWPPEAPRFSYTSNNNDVWLRPDKLKEMINE